MDKLLSFVIPCYRSEQTIEKVCDEIIETVALKDEFDYEIICVNDCSPDGVLNVLKSLAAANTKIKVIDFARNMGKHAALMAGFAYAEGDYVFTVDDDYQCPVYALWELLEPVAYGTYDFATADYPVKKESLFKRFGSRVNLVMSSIMLDKPMNIRFQNFSVMKKFVVKEIIKYENPFPYLDGLIYRVTNNITMVKMEERERGDNKGSGFTLLKSLSLWLNGFTAFSVKPLRISSLLGLLSAVCGFIIGIIMIIKKIIDPSIVAGYTSTIALLLFIGGVIMILLGLIGEYIGRIYICINRSPQYIVKDTINIK